LQGVCEPPLSCDASFGRACRGNTLLSCDDLQLAATSCKASSCEEVTPCKGSCLPKERARCVAQQGDGCKEPLAMIIANGLATDDFNDDDSLVFCAEGSVCELAGTAETCVAEASRCDVDTAGSCDGDVALNCNAFTGGSFFAPVAIDCAAFGGTCTVPKDSSFAICLVPDGAACDYTYLHCPETSECFHFEPVDDELGECGPLSSP
jgi:hypothetical protein